MTDKLHLTPIEIKDVSMVVWIDQNPDHMTEKAKEVLEYIKSIGDAFDNDIVIEKIATMISGRVERIEIHGGVAGIRKRR